MQSRTGAVTQVSILPQSFFLPRGTRAFTVFSLCSANCNEKIAAPRRMRVTNATKICRTSLVARYAAPPCVTHYVATYIASTVLSQRRTRYGHYGIDRTTFCPCRKLTTDGQTSEQSSRRKTEVTKEFSAKQDLESTRGRVARTLRMRMYSNDIIIRCMIIRLSMSGRCSTFVRALNFQIFGSATLPHE